LGSLGLAAASGWRLRRVVPVVWSLRGSAHLIWRRSVPRCTTPAGVAV